MFYLTKFRFMHKHDSLSLSIRLWQLKKKKQTKKHKPSSLVQNNENAKDEESTVLL